MRYIQVVVSIERRVKIKINWTAIKFCILSVTLYNIHTTDIFVRCVPSHHW